MTGATKLLVAGALAVLGMGCAPDEPPLSRIESPPTDAAAEEDATPRREFASEAQAARARYNWSEESLEPYGVEPIREKRAGTRAGT